MAFICLPINLVTTGNHTLIAGQAGKTIKVFAANIQANLLTTFSLKSGTTNLTGPMTNVLGGSLNLPLAENLYYFETGVGEDLILNMSGLTGNLGGFILYLQELV